MSNTLHGFAIVTHGGAGEPLEFSDGCELAARRGRENMLETGDALDAAIAAVLVFEEDDRFNAGTGSVLCLDGATIEMDASIMDTRGRLGAVAAVRDVRNPILLARAVADTPHVLLAGEGAERFARAMGLERSQPIRDSQRDKHNKVLKELAGSVPMMPGIDNRLFERFWNYKTPLQLPPSAAHDTVGAMVRGPDGHFAVAGSTGGSAPSLLGRVGDTPIIGSGFYAGPLGAIAATGIGDAHHAPHAGAHGLRLDRTGHAAAAGAAARHRPGRQGGRHRPDRRHEDRSSLVQQHPYANRNHRRIT
ncbi:MAG: isoaspartyl peptidase/L-asparaginase [Telluria sp.]